MKKNIEIIGNSSEYDNIPKFICSKCNLGLLKLINIDQEQSKISKDQYNVLNEIEYIYGYFISKLKCENSDCQEIYFVSGDYNSKKEYENLYFPEIEDLYPIPKTSYKYRIKFINPFIKIIDLPKNLPDKLLEPINQSFSLYWIDKSACANKIRIAIEILLDIKKIRKTKINNNGKRNRLFLNERINKFKESNPEIANLLLALKVIGNKGSHNTINKNTILDAYKILEKVLDLLYNNKKASEINKLLKKYNKKNNR